MLTVAGIDRVIQRNGNRYFEMQEDAPSIELPQPPERYLRIVVGPSRSSDGFYKAYRFGSPFELWLETPTTSELVSAWYAPLIRRPLDVPLLSFKGWAGEDLPMADNPDQALRDFIEAALAGSTPET